MWGPRALKYVFSVLHFSKRLREKSQKVISSISLNKNMNQDCRPQLGKWDLLGLWRMDGNLEHMLDTHNGTLTCLPSPFTEPSPMQPGTQWMATACFRGQVPALSTRELWLYRWLQRFRKHAWIGGNDLTDQIINLWAKLSPLLVVTRWWSLGELQEDSWYPLILSK